MQISKINMLIERRETMFNELNAKYRAIEAEIRENGNDLSLVKKFQAARTAAEIAFYKYNRLKFRRDALISNDPKPETAAQKAATLKAKISERKDLSLNQREQLTAMVSPADNIQHAAFGIASYIAAFDESNERTTYIKSLKYRTHESLIKRGLLKKAVLLGREVWVIDESKL